MTVESVLETQSGSTTSLTQSSDTEETRGKSFNSLLEAVLDTQAQEEDEDDSGLSGLTTTKQLTKEEEQRLLWLQDQLADALSALGEPTDEEAAGDRRRRIRELQQEIEDLTGVKMPMNLAAASKKLPTTNKDDGDDDEGTAQDDPLLKRVLGADSLAEYVGTQGAGIMDWWSQNLSAAQAAADEGDAEALAALNKAGIKSKNTGIAALLLGSTKLD
ncbi:MAG: hypothetical protein AB7D57_12800 [Desulfovibrionaceae bacterium]